jgi:hypothetical protein
MTKRLLCTTLEESTTYKGGDALSVRDHHIHR